MKTTILSILVLTLISCDATTKEFIGTSWKVTQLTENGKVATATNDVILTIKSDTEFTLKLDKNNCFGTYTITGNNKIKLSNLGCTEMCCDSYFSIAVSNALYKVSTINFEKERATLSGNDTTIKFEKYDTSLNAKQQNMTTETGEFIKNEKIPTKETTDVDLFVKPVEGQNAGESVPKGDSITLYKSPCKGTCEEYTMVMYRDGTVLYTGKFNAQIQGKHMVKLVTSKSESLFAQFEQSNFNNFSNTYDDERIMDIQNTYLTYKGKKIQIRYKSNAPKELQELLKKVEAEALQVLQQLKQ
jgi:heat shock protein HslJ